MTTTLYRAAGVLTASTGRTLVDGEDYRIDGEPHPEDASHIAEGRLVPAETPEPETAEEPPAPKPSRRTNSNANKEA